MGDPRKALDNLTDALVDDILDATDEEIRAEVFEDGDDPDELASECLEKVRQWINEAAGHKTGSSS